MDTYSYMFRDTSFIWAPPRVDSMNEAISCDGVVIFTKCLAPSGVYVWYGSSLDWGRPWTRAENKGQKASVPRDSVHAPDHDISLLPSNCGNSSVAMKEVHTKKGSCDHVRRKIARFAYTSSLTLCRQNIVDYEAVVRGKSGRTGIRCLLASTLSIPFWILSEWI